VAWSCFDNNIISCDSALVFQVDLRDLAIKDGCLDFLHLPIIVKAGYVGKLLLRANWAKLGSEPVSVTLEDVLVIARLRKDSDELKVDPVSEQKRAVDAQLAQLETKQNLWLSEEEERTRSDTKASQDSYSASMAKKIADNIQITIRNIHVRYEDDSDPAQPLALGVTLAEFSGYTTDSKGERKFMVRADTYYKHFDLSRLAIYLNVGAIAAPLTSAQDLLIFFRTYEDESKWHYLLRPLSGELHATLPKTIYPMQIDSVLESLSLILSQSQFQNMLSLASRLSSAQMRSKNAVKAYTPVFRSVISQYERERYQDLYTRTLNAYWLPELTPEEMREKHLHETSIHYDEVIKDRFSAFLVLRTKLAGKKITTRQAEDEKKKSLFSLKKKSKAAVPELTDKDRETVKKQLEADPPSDQKQFAPDVVKVAISFKLKAIGVSLFGEKRAKFLELTSDVRAKPSSLELKSYARATTIHLSFCSLKCVDHGTPGTLFPKILSPLEKKRGALSEELLSLTLERFPLDGSADTKLALTMEGQELVIHHSLLRCAHACLHTYTPLRSSIHRVLKYSFKVELPAYARPDYRNLEDLDTFVRE
jgi:hypothetical protein